jgi:zinc protease
MPHFLRKTALVVALCLLLTGLAFAGGEVREFTLENGLKVLMLEDHKAPLAVFQVWYRVGARNEVSGRSGISHYLEHMMFKGTEKHGAKVLSRTVQRHGGNDNAFTSKDGTVYFQNLPSDRIPLSVDFESDRMKNLILDPEESMSEKSVVMEERRLRYEDDPQNLLYELTAASAFTVHPYRRPIIGWMNDLASISPDDLRGHYRSYYSPDNAFIVVTGDIQPQELMKDIEAAFASIRPEPERKSYVSQEPSQKGEKRVYLKKEAELPYILIAYHAPTIPHEDSYALDVLNEVLSGKSGRLYKSIVYEEQIALNAFADYTSTYIDPYLFILGGTANPGKDIAELEEALIAEIEKIKEDPPAEKEVQKVRNHIESSFIMSQDSIFSQAMLLGRFELLGGWQLKDTYLERIRQVTPEDISRVARTYFRKENRTVVILIPRPGEKEHQ